MWSIICVISFLTKKLQHDIWWSCSPVSLFSELCRKLFLQQENITSHRYWNHHNYRETRVPKLRYNNLYALKKHFNSYKWPLKITVLFPVMCMEVRNTIRSNSYIETVCYILSTDVKDVDGGVKEHHFDSAILLSDTD